MVVYLRYGNSSALHVSCVTVKTETGLLRDIVQQICDKEYGVRDEETGHPEGVR